jgi:hypothetical protein
MRNPPIKPAKWRITLRQFVLGLTQEAAEGLELRPQRLGEKAAA